LFACFNIPQPTIASTTFATVLKEEFRFDFKNSPLLQVQNYFKRSKDNYGYSIDQKYSYAECEEISLNPLLYSESYPLNVDITRFQTKVCKKTNLFRGII